MVRYVIEGICDETSCKYRIFDRRYKKDIGYITIPKGPQGCLSIVLENKRYKINKNYIEELFKKGPLKEMSPNPYTLEFYIYKMVFEVTESHIKVSPISEKHSLIIIGSLDRIISDAVQSSSIRTGNAHHANRTNLYSICGSDLLCYLRSPSERP